MKIFHHGDADGYAAAFAVYHFHKIEERKNTEFIEMQYGYSVDFNSIEKDEVVFIVDFSFEIEDMRKLLEITKNVTWIDHHISSINKYKDFEYDIPGYREDGIAACELAYEYMRLIKLDKIKPEDITKEVIHKNIKTIPKFIRLIGDRDVWKYDFGDETRYFHMRLLHKGLPKPSDVYWTKLFNTNFLEEELKDGKLLLEFSNSLNSKAVKSWSYEAEFEGHKILCLNSTTRTSEVFGDKVKDYDFVSVYTHTGKVFSVSLYSVNMDVNHIAEKFGGGGHARACGFTCEKLPWIIKD